MIDRPHQPYASAYEKWWEDRRRVTGAGVVFILLTAAGVAISAFMIFQAYLTIHKLDDLNSAQVSIWREIGGRVDYLLDNGDSLGSAGREIVINRIQGQLVELLQKGEELKDKFDAEINSLDSHQWLVIFTTKADMELLAKGLPEHLRQRSYEASKASPYIIRGGFSHWDTATQITFQSGNLIDALIRRDELLDQLKSKNTTRLWRLLVTLAGILFGVVCLVWLAILRPAVRALHQARLELSQILDTIPALVTSYDRFGYLETANQAYLERHGNPEKGNHISDVTGPQLWPKIKSKFETAAKGIQVNYDVTIELPGGERMQNAQYVPLKDANGSVFKVIAMITDIQERYESDSALRRSEEKLRITLDSIGDAVISTDTDARIDRMNPVACAMTGWTVQEARGKLISQVLKTVDKDTRNPFDCPIETVLRTGQILDYDEHCILFSRDGKEYSIRKSAAPILAVEDEIVGAVLVFRDATEEIALTARLVDGEKMRAIGQLTGGIAHDFNNSLAVIRGYAEILAKSSQNKSLAHIIATCDRAAALVENLNAFSQQKHMNTDYVDVEDLVSMTFDILRNTTDRRVEYSLQTNAKNCIVDGNSSLLQAAFMNIGLNAVQAMAGGGELSITIDETTISEPETSKFDSFLLKPGQYLSIVFRDTGPGISEPNLSKIFEPYFTTKSYESDGAGAGLGLPMVYGTVGEHHGAIVADNGSNGGAKFTILLPQIEMGETNTAVGSPFSEVGGTHELTVLLVEDEQKLREIGQLMLSEIGCDVIEADDGMSAVEIYREQADDIDLVILDLNMPRMNGSECLEKLKKINPKVHIIITTGFPGDIQKKTAKNPAIVSILRKPYSYSDLSEIIRKFSEENGF